MVNLGRKQIMKLTMSTIKLQEMVQKASKGASENKLLPITSLMEIELEDNVLTLTTTDTANTLTVLADKIEGTDFNAVVPVELFTKLIGKMSAEKVTLTMKDSSLEVKGDGTYNIPLPMDEDGVISYPQYSFTKNGNPEIVHLTTVKNILNVNKAAISKTLDTPCLCGYYVGDKVVTTDENVICINDIKLLNEVALISPEMMELMSLSTEEKMNVYRNDGYLYIETENLVLHGPEHDGIDIYPAEDVLAFLDQEFNSMCKLPKALVQRVIDRLSLFIEPYDKNGAYFTFTKDGVKITSKKSSSVELIAYAESKNFKPFMCCVDIPMLKSQVDANPSEFIELWYGDDAAIKLTSDKVTQVIALLEDTSLEGLDGSAE